MCAQPSIAVELSEPSLEPSLEQLLAVVEKGMGLVCEQALEWMSHAHVEGVASLPTEGVSALIPMASEQRPFEFTITATENSCLAMARAMFMIEEDEALPEGIELSDALAEVANIVAGDVKSQLHDQDSTLMLGIPEVLDSVVNFCSSHHQAMAISEYKTGPVSVFVTVHYSETESKKED